MESGNRVVHHTEVHYYLPSQPWSVPHLQEKKENETRKAAAQREGTCKLKS